MKLISFKDRAISRARESLAAYASLTYPKFQAPYHIKRIIAALEKVESGEIDRLIITLPPRHGKSLIASEIFPAWFLGKHPDKSIIATSYGTVLAQDFGRKVRNHVADRLHRAVFPMCTPAEDSASVNRFNLLQGGAYYAVGSGGALTGRGCDVLLIDDPIKSNEEAASETFRASLRDWYRSVAYTRLQPGGAVILIQTRWHQADLCGWLLTENKEEGWTVLNLPAIAERDEEGRKEGQPLWSEQFPLATLERIREAIGGRAWASLYQQRPAAAEGALFKRDWWKISAAFPEQFERIILSLDTAFKTGAQNDFSVGLTIGVSQNAFYILDVWRDRVEMPDLLRKINVLSERFRPNQILIEDAASGQSVIQTLQRESRLPIKAVKVDRDKISRASAILPLIEAGRVVLPAGAEWVQAFIDETASFPAGARDDQVDALSQVLNFLSGAGQSGFSGLMQLEKARASVAAGVSVEDAAKQVGVAEGRLDAWLDRSSTAPSRIFTRLLRPPRDQLGIYEAARKRVDAGIAVEQAASDAGIDPGILRAFVARANAPLGPSRPLYAPGAVNPLR